MPTAVHAPATELVGRAILAPSSHNTQPWRFDVRPGEIGLWADRTRALPVADPFDRELTMSCGAALLNLRVAAAYGGFDPHVDAFPDKREPDLLARTGLGEGRAPSPGVAELFRAIPARRTYRRPFAAGPLPLGVADELTAAAAIERAWVHVCDASDREVVAELVREGDRMQFRDPHWRRELAMWLHPRRAGDGLARNAAGVARFVVSHLDLGRSTGAHDAELVENSPLLLVLGTAVDAPSAWLAAGQALERLLLAAASHGLQASFLNQPVQVAELRPQLATALGLPGHPQIVLRLGVPADDPAASPRRPLEDVLV